MKKSGPFSLTKLKKLIPVFQEKAQQLTRYFDKQIAAEDGIVESKQINLSVFSTCNRSLLLTGHRQPSQHILASRSTSLVSQPSGLTFKTWKRQRHSTSATTECLIHHQ
jgi:hypothetical protein